MRQDFIFGLKVLLKQKAFTIAALLTLALCIGANTAIFTVLENVVLRPLPFPNSDQLVSIYNIYPGVGVSDRGANATPDYFDRRKLTDVFSDVTLVGGAGYDIGASGTPERIGAQVITPEFFRTLGVSPSRGRAFTEDETTPGKEKVAILSDGLWREVFGRDPDVLGKDIRLSGAPYRVVGVMPPGFGIPGDTDDVGIWVPFAFPPEAKGEHARHSNSSGMIARLKPGVSIQQARTAIDALNRRNLDLFPQFKTLLINARFQTRVLGLKDELTRDIRPIIYLLQIAVAVVLLIGCMNLANLMLVRSNVRMRELAIRASLGAGRWRIARQLLTESVLLALMGGALGLAVGYGGVRALTSLGAKDLPRGADISLDTGALLFTLAAAVAAALAFGSAPLFHVLRRDLNEVFRGNTRGASADRGAMWVRSALVVGQFAFAFVLLIGAGLLTISFDRLMRVNPGFNSERVATARIALPHSRYEEDPSARNLFSDVLGRIRATPGVRYAAITTYLPFGESNNSSVIAIVGRPLGPGENPPVPGWNHISPGYLKAMGIPLLEGRDFGEQDGPDSKKVVMIDEFLAKKYWPNGGAVGSQLMRGIDVGGPEKPDVCTIVGVVGSVKVNSLAENNPVGHVYFTANQYVPRNTYLVIKTEKDDPGIASAVRGALRQSDPELPLFGVKTMQERLDQSVRDRRAAMGLCLGFAALALLLAGIGVYGVLAYSVSQRTREFGIRAALGADPRSLVGMVVGQGFRLAGLGLAIGAAGALLLTRLATSLLFDVKPADPIVYVSVAMALALVAGIASLIPSARVVRIAPSSALRYE